MDNFVLSCVRAQVDAVLSEINRIEGSEFPYKHTQEALRDTKIVFETHRDSLALISEKMAKEAVEFACSTAFVDISESIDLLGFLLRSTNVRNALEAYGPLLRIARALLGKETRLIVSSEWYFSPFTYLGYHYLPGVVLIGLPAPESSNPFLLPLAGHELGHSAWPQDGLASNMQKEIRMAVIAEIKQRWNECKSFFHDYKLEEVDTNLLFRAMWKPAWDWALRQCEEHFCDFFGLRIFGESYLHAFAYLLAPQRRGTRSMIYPNLKNRVACLVEASRKYGLVVPDGYADLFENLLEPAPEQRREKLLLSLADAARARFVEPLQSKADKIVLDSGVATRSLASVESCKKRFAFMVPAERSQGLPNILNAAWQAWFDLKFFRDPEHNDRRLENLREVVLKSIEVFEIETRQEAST